MLERSLLTDPRRWADQLLDEATRTGRVGPWLWLWLALHVALGVVVAAAFAAGRRLPTLPTTAALLLLYAAVNAVPSTLAATLPNVGPQALGMIDPPAVAVIAGLLGVAALRAWRSQRMSGCEPT